MATRSPISEEVESKKLYVRLADLQDVEVIQDIFVRSFQNDPVLNYFGHRRSDTAVPEGVHSNELEKNRAFFGFIAKSTLLLKGRLTIVIDPEIAGKDNSEGGIVAAACWLPPGKRLSAATPVAAMKSGLFKCVKSWGWSGLGRFGLLYPRSTHGGMRQCFNEKGDTKTNIDQTWYLLLTATDPTHQGRGCLSLLVREAFANAPSDIFTLEASTPKSRDQYMHLGYKQPTPILIGKGKVNETGFADQGKNANGFEVYALAKWPE